MVLLIPKQMRYVISISFNFLAQSIFQRIYQNAYYFRVLLLIQEDDTKMTSNLMKNVGNKPA